MSLYVFGGMEQQSEDSGRQLLAADATRLRENLRGRASQLAEGTIDSGIEDLEQISHAGGGAVRLPFVRERFALLVRQGLTPGVGEEAIDHAGDVLQVKSHRRNAGRTGPE